MSGTESRLLTLEAQVTELTGDLRVLRSLVDQDHASALNKIRYVTEKVLHRLCQEHSITWGSGEPTVENMIGPLVAKKIIPRNVSLHVRTIQTNASPGSHFQETPMTATHVNVAQIALLDFLEWFYKVEPTAAVPPAVEAPPKPSRKGNLVIVGALVLAAAASAAIFLFTRGEKRNTPPAAQPAAAPVTPKLRQPEVGLKSLEVYRLPKGSQVTTLDSTTYWNNAERDFREAAQQPGAPVEWTAAAEFAQGQALARSGKFQEATEHYRTAIKTAPQFVLSYTGLAIVLAELGDAAGAIDAAQQAQRIDPGWWGAVAAEARVYVRTNKPDNAIQTYRRALQMAPKDAILLSELALVYHVQHLDSEAERYAHDAISADPDIVAAHLLLAERALEDGKADVALAEATRAVANAPDHLSPRLALADAQALAKKVDDARASYERALEIWKSLDPQHRGEHDARMKLVEEALARDQLPPSRTQQHAAKPAADPGKTKKSTKKRTDERTSPCQPGDPLCGIQ